MAKKDSLTTYQKRRDFTKSPEPKGTVKKTTSKKPIFMIHKHDASHLHYDLRLEIDGVLKSWAIPKGPSTSTRIKRLAIPTDDHPMAYAPFEGIIPEGNYGAGTVMVWDRGTYKSIKEKDGKLVPIKTCYKNGTLELEFNGEKLQGAYALIKAGLPGKWLFIKMKDEYANKALDKTIRDKSVKSGRTMKQIAKEEQ